MAIPGTSVLAMSNNLQTNVNINLVDLLTPDERRVHLDDVVRRAAEHART